MILILLDIEMGCLTSLQSGVWILLVMWTPTRVAHAVLIFTFELLSDEINIYKRWAQAWSSRISLTPEQISEVRRQGKSFGLHVGLFERSSMSAPPPQPLRSHSYWLHANVSDFQAIVSFAPLQWWELSFSSHPSLLFSPSYFLSSSHCPLFFLSECSHQVAPEPWFYTVQTFVLWCYEKHKSYPLPQIWCFSLFGIWCLSFLGCEINWFDIF